MNRRTKRRLDKIYNNIDISKDKKIDMDEYIKMIEEHIKVIDRQIYNQKKEIEIIEDKNNVDINYNGKSDC